MTGMTFHMMDVTIVFINVSLNALSVSEDYVMNVLYRAGK